jgi:hypothetical protein
MRAPLALLVVTATLIVPGAAGAYCRTTTVPISPDFQPAPNRCWEEGFPLFWRNMCVGYSVQRAASRQVAYDDAANETSRAFTKWTGASCPTSGSSRSRVSIDVRDLGAVECTEVDNNRTGANQNVIVFRDDVWPHGRTTNTLALTTVTFNPKTGEIFDADMEINTFDQRVTLSDPVPHDGYDFASIITHEAGHFLGLAHSGDPVATMNASYTPGNTAMRNLTADDVAGICSVYRPDTTRPILDGETTPGTPCDVTPRRGFTESCAEAPEKSCTGSTVATSSRVGFEWIAMGLTALGATLGRRRRRR